MNLAPGTRIENGARSAYVLGDALPGEFLGRWRRARKVFLNYRHADRSLFETGEEESLEVLIREPSPSISAVEFELKVVYTIEGLGCFLPAVDVISSDDGPCLVVADPHATPLMDVAVETRGNVLEGISRLTQLASDSGLVIDAYEPSEFLVDRDGRFYYLGTDRFARIETGQFRREMEHLSGRWDVFVGRVMPEGWAPARGERLAIGDTTMLRSPLRRVFNKLRRPRN